MHMTTAEERMRTRAIAEGLNKSFFAHGDALSRSRARSLNLKIADDNSDLEHLIWNAYLGLESYLQLRTAFKPLEHFLRNGGAPVLASGAPLVLPPGAPPALVNQIWAQVAQNAIQGMAQPALQVDYAVVNAVVESPRRAAEFRTEGTLSAARLAGGEVQLVTTDRDTGWRGVTLPTPATPANPAPAGGGAGGPGTP